MLICPNCFYVTPVEGGEQEFCPWCRLKAGAPREGSLCDGTLLKLPEGTAAARSAVPLIAMIAFIFVLGFAWAGMNILQNKVEDAVSSLRAGADTSRWNASGGGAERSGFAAGPPVRSREAVWSRSRYGNISSDGAVSERAIVFGTLQGDFMGADRLKGRVLWSVPGGKSILASPAIQGPYACAGTIDGKLIGVNMDTGFEEWRLDVGSGVVSVGFVGPTVYALSADGKVAAVNVLGGKKTGEYSFESRCDSEGAIAAMLLVAPTRTGELSAMDLQDGSIRWRAALDGGKLTRACIAGRRVFAGSETGKVFALNLADGKVLWQTEAAGGEGLSSPPASNGVKVAALSGAGTLAVLDATDGKLLWSAKANGRSQAGPVMTSDLVYCGSVSGALLGFDLGSGQPVWQETPVRGQTTLLAVLDGTIYTGTVEGEAAALGR